MQIIGSALTNRKFQARVTLGDAALVRATWVDPMTTPDEPFTRLTPAPDDVVIDREKFTKTVPLIALRVPKVSTRG